MSNAELILGGLKLLVFGMGMVFVFLVVMIIAMNLMQKILAPFAAAFEPAPKAPAKPKAAAGTAGGDRRGGCGDGSQQIICLKFNPTI